MIHPARTRLMKRAKQPKNNLANLWSKILINLQILRYNNNKLSGMQFLKFKISTGRTSESKNIPIWKEKRKDKTQTRLILFKNKKSITPQKNKRKPSTSSQQIEAKSPRPRTKVVRKTMKSTLGLPLIIRN